MEKVILNATRRTVTGKKVGALRRAGQLPGVLYGHHFDSTPIVMDLREATRVLTGLTASSLITIVLEGSEHAALVREKQRDFIKNILRHVDFQVVSLTEKIRAEVAIEITGVAPAIKDFNGVVVNGIDSIEVESFPQYLPQRILVDVSKLAQIGDSIYVRDIVAPENVEILEHADELIIAITAPTEEKEAGEESASAEPEVIERGKKEEEE